MWTFGTACGMTLSMASATKLDIWHCVCVTSAVMNVTRHWMWHVVCQSMNLSSCHCSFHTLAVFEIPTSPIPSFDQCFFFLYLPLKHIHASTHLYPQPCTRKKYVSSLFQTEMFSPLLFFFFCLEKDSCYLHWACTMMVQFLCHFGWHKNATVFGSWLAFPLNSTPFVRQQPYIHPAYRTSSWMSRRTSTTLDH